MLKNKKSGLVFAGLIILSLSACTGSQRYSQRYDSAPQSLPSNLLNTPDAIPTAEPLSRGGNPSSYSVFGKTYYVLKHSLGFAEQGTASWYGRKFHGHKTSNGEVYDMYAMTAAHKNLPLPSYLEVTNLNNLRKVIVRVNDRGPFHGNRIIDLSYVAAAKLDMLGQGTAPVSIRSINLKQPTQTLPLIKPAPATTAKSASHFIQCGAFNQQANAQQLLAKLQAAGIATAHINQKVSSGTAIYIVQSGPYSSINVADLDQLKIDNLALLSRCYQQL